MKPHKYNLHLLDITDWVIVKGKYSRKFHVEVSTSCANYKRYLESHHEVKVSYRTKRKRPTPEDPREGVIITRVPFKERQPRPRKPKP